MVLSRKKQVFLLFVCILLAGSAWVKNSIETEKLETWSEKGDGQFVTPVSTVALFQSNESNARSIDYEQIKNLVSQAIDAAGGLESVVSDGDSVILKPNLVGAGGGRPHVNGVTTDNRVVRAVSEIVRSLNPNGWIGVLEGSAPGGGQFTKDMFELYEYNKSNLPDVDDIIALEDVDGKDKDYDSPYLVSKSLPDSLSLYPDSEKPNSARKIYMAKLYYNADAVISLPVLKNHESAALTVGIKNTSIGMTPPSIYRKNLYNIPNLRFEIDHSYPNMHKWIHDFFLCRPTDFVVVDALQGLQYGPGGGGAAPSNRMNMRLILAGKDLIAADAMAAHLVGLDPKKINYLTYLHNHRAGCADHTLIRVKGNVRVSDVKKKFKHNDARTIAVMISDFNPPDLSIASLNVEEEVLRISLDTSKETELVEIAVDGERIDQAVVSDFSDIHVPWADLAHADHEIEIVAYDAYRNSTAVSATVTAVQKIASQLSNSFELLQNRPNPFNPATEIRYRLPKTAEVLLDVYSLRGERIRRLESGLKDAGEHRVLWDGVDSFGQNVASGLYIYRLQAISGSERFIQSGKMTLVR